MTKPIFARLLKLPEWVAFDTWRGRELSKCFNPGNIYQVIHYNSQANAYTIANGSWVMSVTASQVEVVT